MSQMNERRAAGLAAGPSHPDALRPHGHRPLRGYWYHLCWLGPLAERRRHRGCRRDYGNMEDEVPPRGSRRACAAQIARNALFQPGERGTQQL